MLLYKRVTWSEFRILSKFKNPPPPSETLLAAVAGMAANQRPAINTLMINTSNTANTQSMRQKSRNLHVDFILFNE